MRSIRLLIVEDDRAFLYLIRSAFRQPQGDFSWELTEAVNGEEAIALLTSEEKESLPLPNLVLLDWNLPKVSGGEVLRQMKEHKKLRRIPVLVFSSSDAEADIHDAYDNHANGYITKPGSKEMMLAIVASIAQFWGATAQLPRIMR